MINQCPSSMQREALFAESTFVYIHNSMFKTPIVKLKHMHFLKKLNSLDVYYIFHQKNKKYRKTSM